MPAVVEPRSPREAALAIPTQQWLCHTEKLYADQWINEFVEAPMGQSMSTHTEYSAPLECIAPIWCEA
ncbi:MAG: hypothetical protein Cons2KO_31360 [Congregibacter sp.]